MASISIFTFGFLKINFFRKMTSTSIWIWASSHERDGPMLETRYLDDQFEMLATDLAVRSLRAHTGMICDQHQFVTHIIVATTVSEWWK